MTQEAERMLTDGRGNVARINLASAGRYAVALPRGILQGETVQAVRDKAAAHGWR